MNTKNQVELQFALYRKNELSAKGNIIEMN